MLKLAFLLAAAAAVAAAQDCVTAPVAKGNLTVSCAALDNTDSTVAGDATTPAYQFAVRVVSTAADTAGVRITVSCGGLVPGEVVTKSGVVLATAGASAPVRLAYVFNLATCGAPVAPTVRVEELKVASDQQF